MSKRLRSLSGSATPRKRTRFSQSLEEAKKAIKEAKVFGNYGRLGTSFLEKCFLMRFWFDDVRELALVIMRLVFISDAISLWLYMDEFPLERSRVILHNRNYSFMHLWRCVETPSVDGCLLFGHIKNRSGLTESVYGDFDPVIKVFKCSDFETLSLREGCDKHDVERALLDVIALRKQLHSCLADVETGHVVHILLL